jgi:hypothetical protein
VTMRASSLARLAACPGGAALPQANTSSGWAEAGTERHAWLAELVRTRDPACAPEAFYDAAAAILEHIPAGAVAEVDLSYEHEGRTVLTGHPDVLALLPDAVFIADHKGYEEVDCAEVNWQVRSYAAMAAKRHGRDRAFVLIIYVREGRAPWFDAAELDALELAAILEEVRGIEARIERERAKVAAGLMPDVAEGKHCKYCPAAHACPAKTALIRQLVDGTAASTLAGLSFLSDEEAALAWEEIGRYTALLNRMKTALIARASERPLPLRNGSVLCKVRSQGNESLDGDVAWKVIDEIYGRDAADEAVTRKATKKRIDDAIRKWLPPGQVLTKAKARVYEAIRAAGGSEKPWRDVVEEVPAAQINAADHRQLAGNTEAQKET